MGAGSVVLETVVGTITLNDGLAPPDGAAVSAAGAGNVLVMAQGAGSTVAVNAAVKSGSGDISIVANTNVVFAGTGNVVVQGGAGQVLVSAQSGYVSQAAGLVIQTNGANIAVAAHLWVALGLLDTRTNADRSASSLAHQAAWGDVGVSAGTTITASQARLLNAVNVDASSLVFSAGTGVGVLGSGVDEPLVTEVATVSGTTTASGGINLLEQTAVTVGTTPAFSVALVQGDGTAAVGASVATNSDLATAPGGAVVLVTLAGTITLNDGVLTNGNAIEAGGTGNVLVQAGGSGSSVTATAGITTGSGSITVTAAQDVTLSGTANLVVGAGTGTIDVVATAGKVAQAAGLTAQTNGGNIAVTAGTSVSLGLLDARLNTDRAVSSIAHQGGWGSVAVTAGATGSITGSQARGMSATNIYADTARLESGTGIGVLGAGVDQPVFTELATVAAETDQSGGINLQNASALTVDAVAAITVTVVKADATPGSSSTTALSDVTTASGGSVVLVNTSGDLTLNDGTAAGAGNPAAGVAVSAGGAGNVLVASAAGNVVATAGIQSGSGSIIVSAGLGVSLTGTANIVVAGGAGTVGIVAQSGSVNQAAGLKVQTNGGNIGVQASASVTLGVLDARLNTDRAASSIATQGGWGSVAVAALGGTITGAQARLQNAVNIYGNQLRLESSTGTGVLGAGVDEPVVTEVATLAAKTDVSGGINILEQTAVAVDTVGALSIGIVGVNGVATATAVTTALSDIVTSGNGAVVLATLAGTITLNNTPSAGAVAVSAAGTGNVLLSAGGATSDVLANALIESGTGNVTVTAGRSVAFVSGTGVLTGSGTVDITAAAGTVSFDPNSVVNTTVSGAGGAVLVTAQGSVSVGGVLAGTASVGLVSTAGSVLDAGNTAYATNVTAAALEVTASAAVGAVNTPLVIAVGTVAASAGSGGIDLLQGGSAIAVNTVSVSVNAVGVNAVAVATAAAAQSDLVTTSGGSIVLVASGGTVTLNDGANANAVAISAGGAGNVTVQAVGAGANLVLNAAVDSGSGAVVLSAANSVLENSGGNVDTAGTGQVTATAGSLTQAVGTTFEADAGVTVQSQGDIAVSLLKAGPAAPLSITGGGALVNVRTDGGADLVGGAAHPFRQRVLHRRRRHHRVAERVGHRRRLHVRRLVSRHLLSGVFERL